MQGLETEKKHVFDQLFFKYYKALVRFAYSICGNQLISEEAAQQTFIKLWQNQVYQNVQSGIDKLLFTYTKNAVIDELRKDISRKKHENAAFLEIKISENYIPEEKYRAKAIIETAIESLPRKSKEVFRLAKQEGLSNQEIADYLNVSVKTVENQMTSAYKKMKQFLEPFKHLL